MVYPTLTYILTTAFTLCLTYTVYVRHLSAYNGVLAFFLISTLSVFSISYFYRPVQHWIFSLLNIPLIENKNTDRMSFQEAIQRRPFFIYLYALISSIYFICLYVNLTSIDSAFLFVLFGVLGRLVQVPLAEFYLKERIIKRNLYYAGLLISSGGIILYQLYSKPEFMTSYSVWDLITALIYLIGASINSILFKYATVPSLIGNDKYIPVKLASVITLAIEACFGFVLVIILFLTGVVNLGSLIPSINQIVAILVFGSVVPILFTLSANIVNHIDHVVARAADGIRIGLGAVLAAIIMYMSGDLGVLMMNIEYKISGILMVLVGTFIAFLGSPLWDSKNVQ